MHRVVVSLGLMAAVVATSGCGTLVNLSGHASLMSLEPREVRVYGGVRRYIEDVDGPESLKEMPVYIFAYAFLALDFPLTVVGDTVTLPIAIHKRKNGTAGRDYEWPLPTVLDE